MQCQGRLLRNKVKQKDKNERVNTATVYLVLIWYLFTYLFGLFGNQEQTQLKK